ncbi:MAG TPA: UxaA family hydrolase [Vicinamibacterales bacterium]|nr:UxaA family hydrolase [Vicinamibacterales bacterium]
MSAALVISERDNVATALEPLERGRAIEVAGTTLVILEPVPRGHKVSLRRIAMGEPVVKYGSPIGTATSDIAAGAHVHLHNLASARGRGDLRVPSQTPARIAEPADTDEETINGPPGGSESGRRGA